jgi:hypothetical protein
VGAFDAVKTVRFARRAMRDRVICGKTDSEPAR